MSLIEPKFWEKYKLAILGVGLLVLLGVMAWIVSSVSDWRFGRSIDKQKANVNAAINDIKAINANIAAEQKALNEAITNVAIAKDDYLEATNATDGTREAVNASIQRMKEAANANRNVNAADVEEAMRGL